MARDGDDADGEAGAESLSTNTASKERGESPVMEKGSRVRGGGKLVRSRNGEDERAALPPAPPDGLPDAV